MNSSHARDFFVMTSYIVGAAFDRTRQLAVDKQSLTTLNYIVWPIQRNSMQVILGRDSSRSSLWSLTRGSMTSRLSFCPYNGLSSDCEMTLASDFFSFLKW